MLINQNIQTKYLLLNTNDKTDTTRWNIPTDNNFSQKIKMALVSINNATDNNLNMVFCPTIKDNHYSSLNTHPLIYAGIGYNNQNIINGKQYYDVNGAYFNEIELKTFTSPPQNNFSYPELDGLKPNLWLKFDTGAITTNYGTDNIYVYNINATPNSGISVRGNDSISFNGTNHYLSGTGANLTNSGSFSISVWIYPRTLSAIAYNIISQFYKTGQSIWINFKNTYQYEFSGVGLNAILTTSAFASDLNNWVHLVFTYDNTTKKVLIYRNGVLLATSANILSANLFGYENANFTIGATNTGANYFNGNIDDLRTYQFILNQDQINTIYGSQKNYPIIKNESYILPNDNDPNINTLPNLWCRFETGVITLNDGIDGITITNTGSSPNAGVSVRGNDSVSLNGTNQYLSGVISGISSSSFSVSVWTFNKSGLSSKGVIFSVGNQAILNKQVFIGFGIDYNYKYIFGFYSNDSVSTLNYPEDLDNWVHIVATYNSTTRERKIYRNGISIEITIPIATGQPTPITAFNIGRRSDGRHFNGYIDDLRVYTGTTLTQEEITRIYNGDKIEITEPVIGQDLNPLIWYKFDDSTNIGLDTMGKVNLVQNFANPLMTYDNTTTVRGSGSIKGIAGQSMLATYNFSDIIDEFSICFWMRITTLNTNWDNIIYSINLQSKFLISRNTTTSNFYITFFGSGTTGSQNHFVGGYVADNIWKHYTITTQKTTGGAVKTTSYLNGILNATNTAGTWSTSGILTYGLSSGTANLGFIGNLDDLRMYNRVLSQAQITEIYAGNPYYNLPTASTRYNTDPTNTQYQFEVVDEEQKLINRY